MYTVEEVLNLDVLYWKIKHYKIREISSESNEDLREQSLKTKKTIRTSESLCLCSCSRDK